MSDPFANVKYVIVRWNIKGNPPKERVMLDETAQALKKHYERAFKDKLELFEVEALD